jgi:hypothetical protein
MVAAVWVAPFGAIVCQGLANHGLAGKAKIENALPQKLTVRSRGGMLASWGECSSLAVTTSERNTKKMNQRKHGARLLGLLVVAALGVMAFAASAQAVVPGFLIAKKAVGALKATAVGAQEGVGTMLVPGLNFKLSCTTMTTDAGNVEGNLIGSATLLYSGCTTLSITKSPEEIHCHVKEPITATGILLPAELTSGAFAVLAEKIKALITLHLKNTPVLGTDPCVLPLDNTVTGEVCFEIKAATNDTVKPLAYTDATVQCKERPALEALTEGAGVKDVVKYGAQTVTLDGAAELSLTGAHAGLTLGVSLY